MTKLQANQREAATRRQAGQSAFAALRRDRSDGSGEFQRDGCSRLAFPAAVAELDH